MESLEEQPFKFQDETGWFGMPGYAFNVNPVTYAALVENSLGELGPAYVLTVNPVTYATNCSVNLVTYAALVENSLGETGPVSSRGFRVSRANAGLCTFVLM